MDLPSRFSSRAAIVLGTGPCLAAVLTGCTPSVEGPAAGRETGNVSTRVSSMERNAGAAEDSPPVETNAGRAEPPERREPPAAEGFGVKAASEGPRLSLAVNSGLGTELVAGWPILIEARLISPAAFVAGGPPLTIGLKGRPWTEAVRVEITRGGGGVEWPLQLATLADPRVTLDADRGGVATWFVTPEDSARIRPGEYDFVAVLDTSEGALPGTWRGRTESVPATVSLRGPEPPAEADAVLRRHAFLRYFLARGKRPEASEEVDALLRDDPDDVTALALKSDLLAEDGRVAAALDVVARAMDLIRSEDPNAAEPPIALVERQGALLDKLLVPADTVFSDPPLSFPGRAKVGGGLTEADFIDLLEIEIGDEVILRRIDEVGLAFTPSEASLARIQSAGASRDLMTALRETGPKGDAPLSAADLLDLLRLGIDESAIIERLEQSGAGPIDDRQLEELRGAGATPTLLESLKSFRK